MGKRANAENGTNLSSGKRQTTPSNPLTENSAPAAGDGDIVIGKERFEGFSKIAFEGLVIHEEGRIVDANETFTRMFGYTPEEIRGADGFKMLSPMMMEETREKIASGYEGTYESCFRKKDGTIFPVEVRVKQAELEGKRVRVAAIRDLTQEKQQAQQLKAVFESSQDCILVWDRDYNYLYANQTAMEYAPVQAPDVGQSTVIGKNIKDTLAHIPDFMRLWMSRIDEVFRTGEVMRVEDSVMVGGRLVHSESVLSPIRYPDGQMFAVGVVYRDVTEKKKLLQELEDSYQRYRDLYNHAQVALFVTDADGLLIDCNLRTLDLFGYSRDEPKENYIHKVRVTDYYTKPETRHKFVRLLQRHGRVQGFEVELKRADGHQFWVAISARLVPATGLIDGALYDITASKILTAAEKKVLAVVLQGKSNKEIAQILHRSVRTVEDHRAHIMQKLGVHNLVELVQKAGTMEISQEHSESGAKGNDA